MMSKSFSAKDLMKDDRDDDAVSVASSSFSFTSRTDKLKSVGQQLVSRANLSEIIKSDSPKRKNEMEGDSIKQKIPRKQRHSTKPKGSTQQDHSGDELKSATNWRLKYLILTLAVGFSALIASYVGTSLTSKNQDDNFINVGSLQRALHSKIFGQDEAISQVLSNLEYLSTDELKVILLVGGPGVGKDLLAQTVTAELFRKTDHKCKDSSFILLNHEGTFCIHPKFNVISLETVRDKKDVNKAAKLIRGMNAQNAKGVVFLPILAAKALSEKEIIGLETFKTVSEYEKWISARGQLFKTLLLKMGIKAEMVLFRPVTLEVLYQCMGNKNPTISQVVMQGREFSLNGCKGIDFYL